MTPGRPPAVIVCAEDDRDDQLLLLEAFRHAEIDVGLRFVLDGEELLRYLRREGRFADPLESPTPQLILLDLNMPRMDGHETLAAMKSDAQLRAIPVVILTTSSAERDVFTAYQNGVNSFITKPVTFDRLTEIVRALGDYWLNVVELPSCSDPA